LRCTSTAVSCNARSLGHQTPSIQSGCNFARVGTRDLYECQKPPTRAWRLRGLASLIDSVARSSLRGQSARWTARLPIIVRAPNSRVPASTLVPIIAAPSTQRDDILTKPRKWQSSWPGEPAPTPASDYHFRRASNCCRCTTKPMIYYPLAS